MRSSVALLLVILGIVVSSSANHGRLDLLIRNLEKYVEQRAASTTTFPTETPLKFYNATGQSSTPTSALDQTTPTTHNTTEIPQASTTPTIHNTSTLPYASKTPTIHNTTEIPHASTHPGGTVSPSSTHSTHQPTVTHPSGSSGSPQVTPKSSEKTVTPTTPFPGPSDQPIPTRPHDNLTFRCPVFRFVLYERFKGFPKLDDIVDDIRIYQKDFEQLFMKAVTIFRTIKNPRIVANNLIEEVGGAILERRMGCPATKFQQAVIYSLRHEVMKTINMTSTSLRGQILSVIHGLKDSQEMATKITSQVSQALFESLIESILHEEFADLALAISNLQAVTLWGFSQLDADPQMDTDHLIQIMLEMWAKESISELPTAYVCTTPEELREMQKKILKTYLSWFYSREQSGVLTQEVSSMIEETVRDHGGESAATDYVFFPTDKVVAIILQFSRRVMEHTREYEKSLLDGRLDMAARKIENSLTEEQKGILHAIISRLGYGQQVTTTGGYTSTIDAALVVDHFDKDIMLLRSVLSYMEKEGKVDPNLKALIEDRIMAKLAMKAKITRG